MLMTAFILAATLFGLAGLASLAASSGPEVFKTSQGELKITPLRHASLMIDWQGTIVHVDPVGEGTDYSVLPKAGLILITHAHYDHLDPAAAARVRTPETQVILTGQAKEKFEGTVMANGETRTVLGIKVEAVPAYNLVHMRSAGVPFHPKGEGNGYILTFGDFRVYIAGDTENTPEMKALRNIDLAFLPMNLPYTMTPEMAADAVKGFRPKVVIPYHYSGTDPKKLADALAGTVGVEVRVRNFY